MKLKSINIEEQMKHYNVLGLSIALLENGQIIGTENYGLLEAESDRKVNENSIFSACSISKFLTGNCFKTSRGTGLGVFLEGPEIDLEITSPWLGSRLSMYDGSISKQRKRGSYHDECRIRCSSNGRNYRTDI